MSIWQKIKNYLFNEKTIKQEFQAMLEAEEKMFAASLDEQTKEAEQPVPVKKTGKKHQARKSTNKKKK